MAGLYETFKTDKTLENDGRWIDYGDIGASFKIASADTALYRKFMAEQLRPFRAQIDNDTMAQKDIQRITIAGFVCCILKDWKGVTDENGKELPFNQENAKKVMEDLPVLFNDLMKQARDYTTFVRRANEQTAKNSGNTSAGN